MHKVNAKSILSVKNKMNIYRGCVHGCIYCDSRSDCYRMEHDFEDIEIKENAPILLEEALLKKRNKCMISTGAMTDPYVPMETELRHMRKCLEIIDKYEFGVSLITKSTSVVQDLDILKSINEKSKCVIQMTLTTYDEYLCKKIEPNVSTTKERFEALKIFRDNGIPTIIWLCPILPFINDTEENLNGILDYCIEAKVHSIICFDFGVTLRDSCRTYFYEQLDKSFPGMKEKYIEVYKNSYSLTSTNSPKLKKIFKNKCRENSIETNINRIFSYINAFEDKSMGEQLSLFQ